MAGVGDAMSKKDRDWTPVVIEEGGERPPTVQFRGKPGRAYKENEAVAGPDGGGVITRIGDRSVTTKPWTPKKVGSDTGAPLWADTIDGVASGVGGWTQGDPTTTRMNPRAQMRDNAAEMALRKAAKKNTVTKPEEALDISPPTDEEASDMEKIEEWRKARWELDQKIQHLDQQIEDALDIDDDEDGDFYMLIEARAEAMDDLEDLRGPGDYPPLSDEEEAEFPEDLQVDYIPRRPDEDYEDYDETLIQAFKDDWNAARDEEYGPDHSIWSGDYEEDEEDTGDTGDVDYIPYEGP